MCLALGHYFPLNLDSWQTRVIVLNTVIEQVYSRVAFLQAFQHFWEEARVGDQSRVKK